MKYYTVNVFNMRFKSIDGWTATADDVIGIEDPIDIDIELDDERDEDFSIDSDFRAAIETVINELLDENNGFLEYQLYSFDYTVYE